MSQYPSDSRNNTLSNRIESQRPGGSPTYPGGQQRTERQPTQTYSQHYEPEDQGMERGSAQAYHQTSTTGSRSTERPSGQTYSQSPTSGSRNADKQVAQTSCPQSYTLEGQNKATPYPQPPPKGILSAHYVKPKQTQTPKKYSKDEEVYIRGERDASGNPVYRRLRICCIQWSTTKKEWEYRVKDSQGRTIKWYTERELAKIAS